MLGEGGGESLMGVGGAIRILLGGGREGEEGLLS